MSIFNQKLIKADFEKAAATYDQYAHLQRHVADRVIEFSQEYFPEEGNILDVGCGTGYIAQHFASRMIQSDLAYHMCEHAQSLAPAVNSDMHYLPFPNRSFSALTSSLCLQWSTNPKRALAEIFRVLEPDGIAVIATLGPPTLKELKQVFRTIDGSTHVSPFLPRSTLIAVASETGFTITHTEKHLLRRSYDNLHHLLKTIKHIGASNKMVDRNHALTKSTWQALEHSYNHKFVRDDGVYASWEIIYLVMRKPS